MENKNVSMLLSLYDKEKPEYLKEALTSIFEQTVMPKEIVLVYDGPINEKLQVVVTYFQQKDPHLFTVVKIRKKSRIGDCFSNWIRTYEKSLSSQNGYR
ncbi:hypothetical protein EfmJHP10_08850 [Enterococcus faecium]|nr:hypothetical protein EfmJHP10_08850 [Enterococcus faecium]